MFLNKFLMPGDMTVKTLLFIYNATSGKGKISAELSAVLDTFAKSGYLVTAYPTQSKGDATRAARELGPTFDRVVCSGGDGTLSETVAGLMQLEQPPLLGYIPAGSTNDCAKTLRIPKDAAKAAALAAGAGVPRSWDIGTLNGQPFVYVAAFGAFTEVAYETPQELKNTFGHLAYVMAGIASIPSIAPYHLTVEYDGKTLEDDFYYGMVCNTISVGGMKTMNAQQVVLDDGLFEVLLVKRPVSILELGAGLQALLLHTPMEEGSALISFQAARIKFTSEKPIPWTLDGEYGGSSQSNLVENHPRAITIMQGE